MIGSDNIDMKTINMRSGLVSPTKAGKSNEGEGRQKRIFNNIPDKGKFERRQGNEVY